MLGRAYFELAQRIYRATSFREVVDLLVKRLPALVGASEAVVLEISPTAGVCGIWDHGPIAARLRERIDTLNALYPAHPIRAKLDVESASELGHVFSDHFSPEEYRESDFYQAIHEGQQIDDVIFGLLVSGHCRLAYLSCYTTGGPFTSEAREVFDAILLTARGVLDRLESRNVERRVRERMFVMRSDAPVVLFVINGSGEVMPLNHPAVKMSETWWAKDEPFRQLSEEQMAMLQHHAADAWDDPVTSRWTDVELDLGGGARTMHLLPKLNCEGIVLFPTGTAEDAEEALKGVLTSRQIEIMDWIAEGKTSAEVAIILGISPRTVEKHLEAVFQRLGVENRIAAVRRYIDLKSGQVT